ncbi:MAG: hypothetical protein AAGN66_23355 [Acidobacteriota bacterium]
METFLFLIGLAMAGLGSLVAFVGWVWLIATAFKESTLWGLGSFISIIQIKFVMDYWDEAKRPALVHIGGLAFVFLGALALGAAAPDDGGLLAAFDGYDEYYDEYYETDEEESDSSGSQNRSQGTGLRPADLGAVKEEPKDNPFRRNQEPKRPSLPSTVGPDQANIYLGKRVQVIKRSGNRIEGKLKQVDDTQVVVSHYSGAGRMDFTILKSDIDHLALD